VKQITGIDIDKPKVTGYKLQGITKDSLTNQIFVDVKIINAKKVITFASPIRISNKTTKDFSFVLNFEGKDYEIPIRGQEVNSIPFDLMSATFVIKDQESEILSTKYTLQEFMGSETISREVKCGENFVIVKSKKSDVKQAYYEITIEPAYSIKNCCPIVIKYFVSNEKVSANPQERVLSPQETLSETQFTREKPLYLNVKLPGLLWSEPFLVYSPGKKEKIYESLVLKDGQGRELTLGLFVKPTEKGCKQLFIYAHVVILNETPYALAYYYTDLKNKEKEDLAGQNPENPSVQSVSKITLANETPAISILNKQTQEKSGAVNISSIGNTFAELTSAEGKSLLELGIDISISSCERNHFLYTKVITINPRYILVNKTECEINIKSEAQKESGFTLGKDIRTPLYWKTWDVITG